MRRYVAICPRRAAGSDLAGCIAPHSGSLRTRRERKRVKRLVALTTGLALAAAALYLLASERTLPVSAGPPLDQIDLESRDHLDRVLREADER